MRVVYAGEPEGTCLSRYHGLLDLEDDVHFFDARAPFRRHPWLTAVESRSIYGPVYEIANREFLAFCRGVRPDVIWVDKGDWIWPSTLTRLRAGGAFLVQHNTDALYPARWRPRWAYRLLRRGLSQFELYFTTNLIDYAALAERRPPRTELTYIGYDHRRFDDSPLPAGEAERFGHPMLFIGHYEPRTEAHILALIEAGLPVTVYGHGWNRAEHRDRLRGHVQFRSVDDAEYVKRLKSARVGLCFVSKWNGNETAGRSFEIPASGTFLLAMRTPQHQECYKEGEEAEFFGDPEELVRKARYYLENDGPRGEIARRGRLRCVGSDYSWARYMRDDWAKVREAMAARRGASPDSAVPGGVGA